MINRNMKQQLVRRVTLRVEPILLSCYCYYISINQFTIAYYVDFVLI